MPQNNKENEPGTGNQRRAGEWSDVRHQATGKRQGTATAQPLNPRPMGRPRLRPLSPPKPPQPAPAPQIQPQTRLQPSRPKKPVITFKMKQEEARRQQQLLNDQYRQAAIRGDVSQMAKLLDEGAAINPRLACEPGPHGDGDRGGIFERVADKGHVAAIKSLLDKGIGRHPHEQYALTLAAWNGHLELVKFLVDEGFPVNPVGGGPLCNAAENGHLAICEYLVSKGADMTNIKRPNGGQYYYDDGMLWTINGNQRFRGYGSRKDYCGAEALSPETKALHIAAIHAASAAYKLTRALVST